jgi:hypothetical protein
MSDPDLKPPPIAADITAALDHDRLDYAADMLGAASRFSACAAVAAADRDLALLAVRSRQSVIALKEAVLALAVLGSEAVG